MHIELSEVLICPSCGPDASLVLMVDEREGGWVREGTLACARCDVRYTVRDGRVDFGGEEGSGGSVPGRPELSDPGRVATEVAALLELQRRPGVVLLGAGLAPVAGRVAALAERAHVLSVVPRGGETASPGEPEGSRLTRAVGVPEEQFPVRARRLAGVALWSPVPERLGEAAAALAPGGRLAGLRPSSRTREALQELELEVVVSEERAFVASRPG